MKRVLVLLIMLAGIAVALYAYPDMCGDTPCSTRIGTRTIEDKLCHGCGDGWLPHKYEKWTCALYLCNQVRYTRHLSYREGCCSTC